MIDFGRLFVGDSVLFSTFFKAFAVIGSVMFFIYAIVINRQTTVMLRTLREPHTGFVRVVSYLQMLVSIVLIVLAFTIL